jgi:CRP-like cAMP-binding protein
MFIKLKYLNGTHPGSSKEFTNPVIRVGRAPSCDFPLYDNTGRHSIASRVHAEIRCENDALYAVDLNSSNGTFLNGERIQKASLKNGDALCFGPEGLELQVHFLVSENDETAFLASCPLFQNLSWEVLCEITDRGKVTHYPANSYLFRIGETCNLLYVIYNGRVEISAVRDDSGRLSVVDFLSSGDSLGESLALVGGKHRSEARVDGGADIFSLPADKLAELITKIPDFALQFTMGLCNKLNASEGQLQMRNTSRKLQGDLQHFDLATIMQTINNLRETGILALYSKGDDAAEVNGVPAVPPFTRIYFEAGEARYIKLGARSGEEAFYQLFQMPLSASFSFTQQDLAEDLAITAPLRMPTMNLLLEAHRLQDELESYRAKLPDITTLFVTLTNDLEWHEEETRNYANQIWKLIKSSCMLCEILGKADCSNFTTYRILLLMLANSVISDNKNVPGLQTFNSTIRVQLNEDGSLPNLTGLASKDLKGSSENKGEPLPEPPAKNGAPTKNDTSS